MGELNHLIVAQLRGQGVELAEPHQSQPVWRRRRQRRLQGQMSAEPMNVPRPLVAEQSVQQSINSPDRVKPRSRQLAQARPLGLEALAVGLGVANSAIA
jgi:hypothetical protein